MIKDNIAIRDALPSDLDSVQLFLQPFVENEQLLPRHREELQLLLRHGFIATALGELNPEAEIVGFSAVEIYSRKLAEIQCLAVDPRFQGRGIGRILIHECVRRAKQENILELMAISASDNFLKSCGFDYSLPNQKRALFVRPQESDGE